MARSSGNVHAQPLYIEGGPNGPMIIAVTASNNVYALNATHGLSDLVSAPTSVRPSHPVSPCGNINPVGTIGTPVVDLASRSLFFDALIDGAPKKHFIYLAECGHRRHESGLAGGSERHRHLQRHTVHFPGAGRRGALALVNGIVYCAYSGIRGRLRQLSRLGCRRGHNNPSNVRLGQQRHRRRYLGTQRRCQRRHQHVRHHREHVQHRRQLDGRRSDYPLASRPL